MKINFFKLSVYFISSLILILFLFGLNKDNTYDTRSLINKDIGKFQLQSLDGVQEINQEDLKNNKFTLINFWGSWCAPCRKEHKFLLSLYKDNTLKMLGINYKDKKKNAEIFLKDLGNPYHFVGQDLKGKISVSFGIYGIPESILIDSNLIIIKKFVGPLDENDLNEILRLVKSNEKF
jgi:cytochrome c biogenesis protein CcmG, thiol:disulfide interchange protein DsbE|tara:strand:- start:2373 stop:2906 length:534 start_codon:yes stop_codon:yes gene_type:complete